MMNSFKITRFLPVLAASLGLLSFAACSESPTQLTPSAPSADQDECVWVDGVLHCLGDDG